MGLTGPAAIDKHDIKQLEPQPAERSHMRVTGQCHCGDTTFEMLVNPTSLTSCTCSICAKRGALWIYCRPDQFHLINTPKSDSIYSWRKHFVRLHFCGVCGCTTYNESPTSVAGNADFSKPLIAVNARLLNDVDVSALPIQIVTGENLW